MENRYVRPTCLSAHEHNDRILDPTVHYFGCLRVSERADFLARLSRKSKKQILEEERRVAQLRSFFEAHPKSDTGAILKKFEDAANGWHHQNRQNIPDKDKQWLPDQELDDSVDANIKARVIFFKNSRQHSMPGLDNEFPNQTISVQQLLAEDPDANPLMKPCEENMIRYFHFPANNMIWIEEAIARYCHENRADPHDFFLNAKPQDRSKAQILLQPEFWQGQQHGDGNSEVHARHMRPLCDVISSDTAASQTLPNNMVLFMHYLHWETDRGRTRSANAIKEAGKAQFSTLVELVDQVTANEHISRPDRHRLDEFNNSMEAEPIPGWGTSLPTIHRRMALGQMLFQAAKLADAMNSHVDESLIHKYLHQDSPLHPRRTLDQSYYGALKNTQTRDRDQVVYRATNPGSHTCRRSAPTYKCGECQEDIRKVARVIMVDQLWMWILDDNTIITSFPRTWGRGKPDPSAVHRSIRTRLETARDDEVRSVFDLALIIVDQCSRVFFDRSKPISMAPKLVDIFADAIRGVTYKQTAAFDQFLTYTHLASKNSNSKDNLGNTAMQNALLNINPEGNLLKEVKDILDELHIMTRIKVQQQVVAEAFVRHIRHILLPKLSYQIDPRMPILGERSVLELGNTGVESAKWTLARAESLLQGIQDRISELKVLEDAANSTSRALKDLLTLKQQQAGVIEAREAVKQATETLKQGRSIMLFTVVTIVFLPLGFCASVFGMNTAEFNGGLLNLHEEFYYMFSISIAIICTSLLFAFSSSSLLSAFSSLILAMFAYPINVSQTWFLTKTGLYTLSRDLVARSNSLKDKERKRTGIMKANAMREKMDLREKMEQWKDGGAQEAQAGEARHGGGNDVESNGSGGVLHYK